MLCALGRIIQSLWAVSTQQTLWPALGFLKMYEISRRDLKRPRLPLLVCGTRHNADASCRALNQHPVVLNWNNSLQLIILLMNCEHQFLQRTSKRERRKKQRIAIVRREQSLLLQSANLQDQKPHQPTGTMALGLYATLTAKDRYHERAGGMTQWLKALAALPEHLDLIPSTHLVAHSCL